MEPSRLASRGAVALGPRTGLPLRSSWRGAALSAMTPRAHCIVYVSGITHRTLPQQTFASSANGSRTLSGVATPSSPHLKAPWPGRGPRPCRWRGSRFRAEQKGGRRWNEEQKGGRRWNECDAAGVGDTGTGLQPARSSLSGASGDGGGALTRRCMTTSQGFPRCDSTKVSVETAFFWPTPNES